jgi:pantoate--beta-alanine ligase
VPEGPIVERFEGSLRPGHFRGVATIVVKLLNLTGPDRAYFGRKDAQQAAMIRRMVDDLNLPTAGVIGATARDADGLALSSRNRYLSPGERAAAPGIYKALEAARARFQGGERAAERLRSALSEDLRAIPAAALDYADLVDPATFVPWTGELRDRLGQPPAVLAIAAARLGTTRLLDNLRLDETGP